MNRPLLPGDRGDRSPDPGRPSGPGWVVPGAGGLVDFVADHAKRASSLYPIARSSYYGVDYSRGADISWYKDIPVPTSYMVTKSNYDFFGGYDHAAEAGVVHVADRHYDATKHPQPRG